MDNDIIYHYKQTKTNVLDMHAQFAMTKIESIIMEYWSKPCTAMTKLKALLWNTGANLVQVCMHTCNIMQTHDQSS